MLIEHQQSNGQKIAGQQYLQSDSTEPLVTGQVIHTKAGFMNITMRINHIVHEAPPCDGQTISARLTLLGRDGEISSHWSRDSEHHHLQAQAEVKHPWFKVTYHNDTRCIAIDTTSCVVVYAGQFELTFRLMPRWLAQRLNNDTTTTKAVETSLQNTKVKAEQNFKQALIEALSTKNC